MVWPKHRTPPLLVGLYMAYRGGIDGHCAGVGGRVWSLSRVQLQRLEVLRKVRHLGGFGGEGDGRRVLSLATVVQNGSSNRLGVAAKNDEKWEGARKATWKGKKSRYRKGRELWS